MLFLLSPAKSLDYETPVGDVPHTLPQFVPQSKALIEVLRQKSPQQISELMDLSDALSALNVARYEAWRPKFTANNSKQAVLAFNGDVYEGLDAKTLNAKELDWAQNHVCILSGLYGVLRPLDWMQPYRLEMGTTLQMSDPLQRAQAQADLAAQSIIRNAAKSAREIGNEADILRGQAVQAVQAQNDLLAQASSARGAARAAELRQLAAEQGQQAATASGMASALQERLDKINASSKLAADQATAKPAMDGAASAGQRLQSMQDEMAAMDLVRTKKLSLAQAIEQVATARLNDARADAVAKGQTDRVDAIDREIEALGVGLP